MKRLQFLLWILLALPIGMLAQGSTWKTATAISNGNSGNGTLDKDTKDAWFKIDVPEEGTVTLTITPGGTLDIQYVDFCRRSGDNTYVRQNMNPGKEKGTLTVTDAGKGTYYLHVHRWDGSGSFSLGYQFTACPYTNDAEKNDAGGQGSTLKSGETVQGRLGYLDGDDYRDKDDWYKLEVPKDGTVRLTIDPSQTNALDIQYVDFCRKSGENYYVRQNMNPGLKKGTLEITDAGVGTYYVHVHRWDGHGGYSLRYDFIANDYTNDAEPNDDGGQGATLKSGKTVQGHLGYLDGNDYRDKDDWYVLKVTKDGTVRLTIDPNQDNALDIQYVDFCRKSGDNYYVRQHMNPGPKKGTLDITDAGVGTYYVHVHRWDGHGGYKLRYDFIENKYANDAESNDAGGKGSTLEDGVTVEGHLGYLDGNDNRDKDDWYVLEVPRDGTVRLTIDPNQDNALNIQYVVFCRKSGDNYYERQHMNPGLEKGTLDITDAGVGTYYVHIHRWDGHGGYKLRYDFIPNSFTGDDEPNNTGATAIQTLTDGMIVKAHLGYLDGDDNRDKDDWYKIEIPKTGGARIIIVPEQEHALDIQYVDFCRKSGDNYYEYKHMNPGQKADTLVVGNLSQGSVFWIHVHRWDGHGGYTLKYQFEPITYFDAEPNDDSKNAITIKDGETKVGNLGFLKGDSSVDEDDWYKATTTKSTPLYFSYVPDESESVDVSLTLYSMENGELKKIKEEWAHQQSKIIQTEDDMKAGTYYLKLHRNSGAGTYTLSFGTPRRSQASAIRVHYSGWPSVRKGIPGSFQVTVENTSAEPSCSFWLSMSYTDDIKLLYAELPTPNGTQKIDVSEMGDEQYHNAMLLFPGLKPFEKYTFTVWAEGYVKGKNYTARGANRIVITGTTLLVVGAITGIVTSMAKDRVEDMMQDWTYKNVQTKEVADRYNRAYGTTMDDIKLKREKYDIMAHGMTTVAQQVGEKVASLAPGGSTAAAVAQAAGTVKKFADPVRRRFMVKYGRAAYLDELMDEILDERPAVNNVVTSWDPNEMCGPVGYGDENYIGETSTVDYCIFFENKKEATAPAYRIHITDELDEKVFDVSTVRFGGTSHDDAGFGWKMSRDGNKLTWEIEGIELPPNKKAPEGEGYVTFSVDLKPGIKNKGQIKNKATIVFDYNDPIKTNEYVNTFDLQAPTASMVSATINGGKITVTCKGSDGESGISHYKFYASEKGGEFQMFANEFEPKAVFTIPSGKKAENYKFYALAVDNVGNTQQTPPTAIAAGAATSKKGDVTGDGKVNGTDIQAVINVITEEEYDEKADVNNDKKVNGTDIQEIINIIVNEE